MKRITNFFVSNFRLSRSTGGSFIGFITLIILWKFLGKFEKELTLTYKGKSFYFVVNNRMDLAVLSEIFVNKEYEFDYRPHLATPYEGEEQVQIILDLGANIGDTAIFYALNFPNAKIFAVEPNPHVHEKLLKNTKQFSNITVCKCAVSDRTGKINLNFGDSHLGSSINTREQNKNSVEVDVYSLEDFCKKEGIDKIDVLKFDIEGAEEYLLKDAEFIKNNVAELVGEMHDDLVTTPLKPIIDNLHLQNIQKKTLSKSRYILYGNL